MGRKKGSLISDKRLGTKKVLFVVSDDWYFLSHRIRFAKFLKAGGFDVGVACADTGRIGEIELAGIKIFPLHFQRKSLGSRTVMRELTFLKGRLREFSPDIVHAVAFRMILLTWLSRLFGSPFYTVNAVAGMGTLFSGQNISFKLRVFRFLLIQLFPVMLKGNRVTTVFQNSDDFESAISRGWCDPDHCQLIRGVGVQLHRSDEVLKAGVSIIPIRHEREEPVVLFVGRLLGDKGVFDLLKASELLKEQGIHHQLRIVGGLDEANPNCLKQNDVDRWSVFPWITFTGRSEEVTAELLEADIFVLPSFREGLPKVLLEAGAVGLPVVTCDVVGCREVVEHGRNGLLVPPADYRSLAGAIKKLVLDPKLRLEMGSVNLEKMRAEFSEEVVFSQFLQLYSGI